MADTPTADATVRTFAFSTLQAEGERTAPMVVTERGTLLVAGRTEWQPVGFDRDLRGVVCARVDQGHGEATKALSDAASPCIDDRERQSRTDTHTRQ